jgi:hypothetical protein
VPQRFFFSFSIRITDISGKDIFVSRRRRPVEIKQRTVLLCRKRRRNAQLGLGRQSMVQGNSILFFFKKKSEKRDQASCCLDLLILHFFFFLVKKKKDNLQ